MALILDTGPILASLDRRDRHHAICVELLSETSETLLIPSPVLVELDYFLGKYGGKDARLGFLIQISAGAYRVEDLVAQDYVRVEEVIRQYAGFDIGFVDAAILAVVERLGEPKLATLDRRHFGAMKPRHVLNLQLLPA